MRILGNLRSTLGKKDPDVALAFDLIEKELLRLQKLLDAKALKPQGVGETGGSGTTAYTFSDVVRRLKAAAVLED